MISDTLKIALLSLALVSLSFWLQGNIGLDLVDEGFLWYGTQRTALGEVPLRDFRSYDPGRYYWGAMWFQVLGDGIIPLRISLAVFQFIGLTCGLLSLRRLIQSWWMLIVFGMMLLTWMAPLHRTFETTINMSAIYVAVCLIEKPTLPRHFVAGVFIGVAGFFGRNHGLYSFGAFLFLVLFIWGKIDTRDLVKRVAAWGVGMFVGYSPMLFMFFLIPGFFQSFIEGIVVIVRRGTTNLPRAVPWPWLADVWSHPDFRSLGQALSIGMFFVLLPVFHAFALLSLVLSPRENVRTKTLLTASTAVGVMYVHYAFSRADLTHLAGSIHPLLIGLIALPCSVNRGAKRALNLIAAKLM